VSTINARRVSVRPDPGQPVVDWLLLGSCLPALVVGAVVLILAGGFDLSFLIPAVVVGAMLGTLMYVSIRDRTRN
jgi:ribose/xylose/arabinose/galactoside ABC-type transport system permease subunit